MIYVVEGPSAAGKTCHAVAHESGRVVAEAPGDLQPRGDATPEERNRFWVRLNEERWGLALAREAAHGLAVCDTDPLKLHYVWTLTRAGLSPTAEAFAHQLRLTRKAVARRTLGIADLIGCVIPPEPVLRVRRAGDSARRRRNFESHLRLAGPLREWYGALGEIDPGRVVWDWPDEHGPGLRRERYDLDLFDAWMDRLPPL